MDEITKSKKFEPNNNQLRYLEVFKNQTNEDNKSTLAERAGVTTKTIWEWEKNPDFIEWIAGEVDKSVKRYTPAIKLKIFEKALSEKATVQERELALRVANEYIPTTRNENVDVTDDKINKVLEKARELIES